MKITEIEVNNFRGINNMVINPDHLNIYLGNSGSGKSSLLKAICFGLSGEMDNEDIREGHGNANVRILFEDGTEILRSKKNGGSTVRLNKKVTSQKSLTEYLEGKLNTNVGVFSAMLNADYFQMVSQKDLTELFLSILPLSIDFDGLCQMIREYFNAAVALTDEEISFIMEHFPTDGQNAVFGIDDLNAAYKSVYEERRTQKVLLKAERTKAEFKKEIPSEKKKDLEDLLYAIAKKEAEAVNHKKAVEAYEKAVKMRAEAEKRKKVLIKQMQEFEAIEKPDSAILEKAKSERKQFEDAVANCNTAMAAIKSNLGIFEKTLENLDKPVCPISEKLVCTTDKTHLKDELTKNVAKNKEVLAKQTEYIARCKEQIVKRDMMIEAYNKQLLSFTKKEGLQKQIDSFVLPELPEKPGEIEAVDYAASKKAINDKLQVLAEYQMALDAMERANKIAKRCALCEKFVEALDPKSGIRSTFLKKALTPYSAICEEKIKEFGDNSSVRGIKFECVNGIQITIKTANSNGFIPMDKVSSGEFVFVIYLLSTIINKVTNAPYLIIDNLDKLDAGCFKILVELLSREAGYEHIFTAAVDHDDTQKAVNDVLEDKTQTSISCINFS